MSKYAQYSHDVNIFPHKHCPTCDKMIEETEDYCSERCGLATKSKDKKQKRQIFIFIGIYAVVIVVFVLFMFLGRK
jgi:predicted nucleic acid-binding Zn ribbon protein